MTPSNVLNRNLFYFKIFASRKQDDPTKSISNDLHNPKVVNQVLKDVLIKCDSGKPEKFNSVSGKTLIINDLVFNSKSKVYTGKILNIRDKQAPGKWNARTNKFDGITLGKDEEIAEPAHFIFRFQPSRADIILGFESTQLGPRVGDLVFYLQKSGNEYIKKFKASNIFSKDFDEIKENTSAVSSVKLDLPVSEISKLGLTFTESQRFDRLLQMESYAELSLEFKVDLKKNKHKGYAVKQHTDELLSLIVDNDDLLATFNKFVIRAKDKRTNEVRPFDLKDYVRHSPIKVAKEPSHKLVITPDMYEKMTNAVIQEFKG